LISRYRIRIFDKTSTWSVGTERCVIYDAKNVGTEVYANDVGSAFWTLPIDHPLIPELVPLKRHYKVERWNGTAWVLVGQGLLASYDATNDEIVYEGMDYMTMLSMHYTKLIGPESGTDNAITRPGTDEVIESADLSLTAIRSASTLEDVKPGIVENNNWNSNDTEEHLPVGTYPFAATITAYSVYYDNTFSSWAAGLTVNSVPIAADITPILNSWVVVESSVAALDGDKYMAYAMAGAGTPNQGTIVILLEGTHTAKSTTAASGTLYYQHYEVRSLIKFDVPDISTKTIGSAILRLTGVNGTGDHTVPTSTFGNSTLRVRRMTADWTGDSTTGAEGTWGNSSNTNCDWYAVQSNRTTTGQGTLSFTGITDQQTYDVDVTTIVNAWKTNTNHGVVLENSDPDTTALALCFYSTAATAARKPKLYISYTSTTTPGVNTNSNGLSNGPAGTRNLLLQRNSNSYGRHAGNPIAIYCTNDAGQENQLDISYSEASGFYTLTGIVCVERAARDATKKLYDIETDNYVPTDFGIRSIKLAIKANPGDEVCTFNVWPSSWTEIGSTTTTVKLKWRLYIRPYGSTTAEDIDPEASAPSLTTSGGILGYWSGTTPQIVNSYSVNCLAQGLSYSFSAFPMVEVVNKVASTTPDYGAVGAIHDLNGGEADSVKDSTSLMGLESKTLNQIFSARIPEVASAGGSYGRFQWLTHTLVPGQSWSSVSLRYFTSGESVLDHLRAMSEKEMTDNRNSTTRYDTINGIKIPWRTVFNFVGIRGGSAPGSTLYVAPAQTTSSPQYVFNYPGQIDQFRHKRDGRALRNSVRVVPATAFLVGSTTSISGSRSQGKLVDDTGSQQEFGYAPLLRSESNFADAAELEKYAKSLLDMTSDMLNVSATTITLAPDSVNPFEDFYLGDIVTVNVRRDNVNYPSLSSPHILEDAYVIGGVRIEVGVDGAEKVSLDLIKAAEFGRK